MSCISAGWRSHAGRCGAIACWLVVWLISVAVSLRVAHWALLSPLTAAEHFYMFGVFFQGVLLLVPVGLACSTFFLRVKRDVRLFIACAVPVGFATGLSPVLLALNRLSRYPG